MTTQNPAAAEIEKWLQIQVWFVTGLWLRSEKMQNPAGVDSSTLDPWPPLLGGTKHDTSAFHTA